MSASDRPLADASAADEPTAPATDSAESRLDLRLLLPAAAAWLTAVFLTARPVTVSCVTVAITATAGLPIGWAVLRHPTRRTVTALGVLLMVTGAAAASGMQVHKLTTGPLPTLATQHATATVHLKVTSDPAVRTTPGTRRPPYVVARATVEQLTHRGTTTRLSTPVLLIGGPAWRQVRLGQRVQTSARLAPANRGDDIAAVLSTRSTPKVLNDPAWWLRAAEHVRAGLRTSVEGQPPPVRGLVPALVMGDESALPPDLVADFQATGLTHLSAVSGTNLTLLLAFVLPLARLAGVRARGLTAVGLATVVVFVVLARPQPSVLRAAVMGLVALAALTTGGGRRRAVRSLSAAVIALLLLDVSLARSAGFALSVLATAGIVLFTPAWRDALAGWLPPRLAEAVACPLAAQLACTPVVAWLSGEISLIAVAANLLAGPAVAPATVLGFAAAGAALLSADLAHLLGWLAAWPARWIILIATHGADLPGATNPWPTTTVAIAVLTALCVVLALTLHRLLTRPLAMLVALALIAFAVLRPVGRFGWPPPNWFLVACAVGQGDGLVLRAGPATAVVVDTGPDPALMDRCLKDLGITHVPVLLITHFHADHAGGVAGVLHNRRVDQIEVTPYYSPPPEHRRVTLLAATRGIPVRPVTSKERRTLGALTWTTLWPTRVPALPITSSPPALPPPPSATQLSPAASLDHTPTTTDRPPISHAGQTSPDPPSETSSPENNASITLLVETAGHRILLTGDLEPESQRALLATHPDLRADILKVPHHGSARQDPTFITATHARLAVISAGPDNDYGHPAPRTLDLLTRAGMTITRTDTTGAIAVATTNNRLTTTTQLPSP